MRKLYFLIIGMLFLNSCLDTEEKITVNSNSSGEYSVLMDLSKILQMASQFGAMGDLQMDAGDTTILFKQAIDTASALTANEKKLFREGKMQVQYNDQTSQLNLNIHFPFASVADLGTIKASYMDVINKLKLMEQMNDAASTVPDMDLNTLRPGTSAFNFAAGKNKFSNSLQNKEAFKQLLQSDSTLQMVQQMAMFLGESTYKTTFQLATPIKSYKGNEAILSKDKKTITFVTSLSDLFNSPEKAEYELEY